MKLGWTKVSDTLREILIVWDNGWQFTGWSVEESIDGFNVLRLSERKGEPFTTREEARAYAEVCCRVGVRDGS